LFFVLDVSFFRHSTVSSLIYPPFRPCIIARAFASVQQQQQQQQQTLGGEGIRAIVPFTS
jgi:hypothetical protein